MDRELYIWTIYKRPPYGFVARKYRILATGPQITDDETVGVSRDLELMRQKLSTMGLYPLGREPDDQEDIVESWI
jgi:hypothetical protein